MVWWNCAREWAGPLPALLGVSGVRTRTAEGAGPANEWETPTTELHGPGPGAHTPGLTGPELRSPTGDRGPVTGPHPRRLSDLLRSGHVHVYGRCCFFLWDTSYRRVADDADCSPSRCNGGKRPSPGPAPRPFPGPVAARPVQWTPWVWGDTCVFLLSNPRSRSDFTCCFILLPSWNCVLRCPAFPSRGSGTCRLQAPFQLLLFPPLPLPAPSQLGLQAIM